MHWAGMIGSMSSAARIHGVLRKDKLKVTDLISPIGRVLQDLMKNV